MLSCNLTNDVKNSYMPLTQDCICFSFVEIPAHLDRIKRTHQSNNSNYVQFGVSISSFLLHHGLDLVIRMSMINNCRITYKHNPRLNNTIPNTLLAFFYVYTIKLFLRPCVSETVSPKAGREWREGLLVISGKELIMLSTSFFA